MITYISTADKDAASAIETTKRVAVKLDEPIRLQFNNLNVIVRADSLTEDIQEKLELAAELASALKGEHHSQHM